jgi:mannose/fructose/N-acetylgalactosamine-specific phosphotransferase system component IID
MNRAATVFLRLVVVLIAIAALAVCVFPLLRMIAQEAAKTPDTAWQIYLFLVGAYVQAALFLFALYQGFKLLGYVDGNKAFSERSVKALRHIKRSAITIGLLMVAGIGWLMFLSAGTGDDSAGPVMIGLIGAFASSVVAAAAMVLQTLVQKALGTTMSDLLQHQK